MINEPTAAALSYESSHHGQKNILVYDLGGGTFDVSVVKMQDEVVEVIARTGPNVEVFAAADLAPVAQRSHRWTDLDENWRNALP